jgi:simple sugar transport system ATP-binding protein
LYISHKLEEVRALCDTATILRNGSIVKSFIPSKTTSAEIAELMVGQKVKPTIKIKSGLKATILKIKNLSIKSKNTFGTNLKNINFELHQGEILGIGGVAGSGQDELLSALTGETNLDKNTLFYKNKDIGWMSPKQRREIGLLTAPEERLGHAAAPEMNLIENCLITAKKGQGLFNSGWIDLSKAAKYAEDIINKFDVRTDSAKNSAKNLSGGNLQKFLIGRELNQNPEVLVVNQPTWGVDASAAQFIRQSLLDLISKGNAVIVISQDLDELLEISDRFTALVNGSISKPQLTHTLSVSEIGLMLSTENRTGLEA